MQVQRAPWLREDRVRGVLLSSLKVQQWLLYFGGNSGIEPGNRLYREGGTPTYYNTMEPCSRTKFWQIKMEVLTFLYLFLGFRYLLFSVVNPTPF